MKIETYHFGEIEVADEQTLYFEHGIPGFEQLRRFAVIEPEETLPFAYLQSLEDGMVSFLMTDPFIVYRDYDFHLSEVDVAELKIESEQDVQAWCIVTMKEAIEEASINLLAPIIVNKTKRCGKQVVLHDTPYTTKHKLIHSIPVSADKEGEDSAC